MSKSFFTETARKKPPKIFHFYCSFMLIWCLMRNTDWFLCLGYGTPQLFTTLNVMSGFFLLFDASMDISHGKFISRESCQKHFTNFPG